jgi:hypothetical protein
MRPLHQWTTRQARDNISVAFSRTADVTMVAAAAAGSAAACLGTYSWPSTSDQDAANGADSGIAAASDSICNRARARQTAAAAGTPFDARQQNCVCLDYKIPARIAVLSRGRTVLGSV